MNSVSELFSLTGEIVLVTGASRGIGAAIADLLGAAGATVVGTGTTQTGAEAITGRFASAGITGRGIVMDVVQPESIETAIADIVAQEGAVSVLVNNAGITRDNLLMRMKDEEWDAIMQTNLTSVYRLSKAVLRGMMKSRRGRIISVSSVVGTMGNPGQSNYAAAKAGLIGFSKSLAKEVGSRGITVNVVAPGLIETEMIQSLDDEKRVALTGHIPLNRLGRVDDIAGAVLFLASSAADYVTGETIHINGGMSMI